MFAGDEKLTTALLDRLAHHATVITTKGKSYRMRKRRPPALVTPESPSRADRTQTTTAQEAVGTTIGRAARV